MPRAKKLKPTTWDELKFYGDIQYFRGGISLAEVFKSRLGTLQVQREADAMIGAMNDSVANYERELKTRIMRRMKREKSKEAKGS